MAEYQGGELVTVYRFDQAGHYTGEALAQVDPIEKRLLVPDDCVTFAPPAGDDSKYYTIKADKSGWDEHAWPASAADCAGIFIEHEDHCEWAEKMRQLFERLTKEDSAYRIHRDEDTLCLNVEAVPAPTSEETAQQEAQAEADDMQGQIEALKNRAMFALLQNDEEALAQARSEFNELMGG